MPWEGFLFMVEQPLALPRTLWDPQPELGLGCKRPAERGQSLSWELLQTVSVLGLWWGSLVNLGTAPHPPGSGVEACLSPTSAEAAVPVKPHWPVPEP